jgi:hypothetical protein
MELWDSFSNYMAGNDTAAQEAELAAMKAKLAEAKRLAAGGVAPEVAAAVSGFGVGQALGGGSTGSENPSLIHSGLNALANWGSGLFGNVMTGLGTPDPGSGGEVVATAFSGLGKLIKVVAIGGAVLFVGYFLLKGKT